MTAKDNRKALLEKSWLTRNQRDAQDKVDRLVAEIAKPDPPLHQTYHGRSNRIATLPRGLSEQLRVSMETYKEHPYVEIRTRITKVPRDAEGRRRWENRGDRFVTIRPHELRRVIDALAQALRLLEASGENVAPMATAPREVAGEGGGVEDVEQGPETIQEADR